MAVAVATATFGTSVFAAQSGLYVGNTTEATQYYSTTYLPTLNISQKVGIYSNLQANPNNSYVVFGNQYQKFNQYTGIGSLLTGADTILPASVLNMQNNTTINPVTGQPTQQELRVESISAINAKEVEIKFNKAVDESTVIDSSNPSAPVLKSGVFTFTSIGHTNNVVANAAAAKLSKDGKTLTIVPATFFNGDYAVTITKAVKDTEGNTFGGYSELVSLKDTVRPTVTGVTYPVNGKATVKLSEAIDVANAAAVEAGLTITDDKGATVTVTELVTSVSLDKKSFDLNIAGFTAKKNYTVKLVGLKDFSGNLISPNPTTLTVVNNVVDDVKPEVVGIEVKSDKLFTIQFSEELNANPTVNLDGVAVVGTISVDSVDKTKYNVTLTTPVTGLHNIQVAAGFTDKSGNSNATAWSKLVEFKADTTAPKYVSHEVKKLADGKQYLIVKFDENVTVATGTPTNALTGTYIDADSITHTATPIVLASATSYDPANVGTSDSIKIDLSTWTAGQYTAKVEAGLVKDAASTPNASAAKTVTFTLGTVGDTTKPAIVDGDSDPSNGYSGITVQATEDIVEVKFTEDVTAATALNVNNYLVEGVAVFEKAIFKGDAQTVELTLKANAISVNGDREFTIKNVADKAGNVMNTVTSQVAFKENVKPELVSAKITAAQEITVTFSEDIAGTAVFEVYVDGVKQTTGFTTGKLSGKTVKIDATGDLTLSKTYEVKYVSGIKDVTTPANTAVEGTTVTVTN